MIRKNAVLESNFKIKNTEGFIPLCEELEKLPYEVDIEFVDDRILFGTYIVVSLVSKNISTCIFYPDTYIYVENKELLSKLNEIQKQMR